MFTLISGLVQMCFAKPTYKILILGVKGAGKTTMLNKLKSMYGQKSLPNEKITPTVGLNIARIEQKSETCLFWDLGGASNLRKIWTKYYPECHGIVFVIDLFDPEKLEESMNCLSNFLRTVFYL
eukprot:TRINITY_DN9255_c0_g1_i2.p1 TRINITY_DN9255_c0_g1~~TRINITY_DN9255_c0_g1_i2.p1  ORF type:complete len:124 (-),score=17.13 TRINITY_DN9255_c0_g1_i2:339-710(-)